MGYQYTPDPVVTSGGVLQYLHVENATTHYVVSGAGSKTDYFPAQYWDNGGSIYQHQGSGMPPAFQDTVCDFDLLDCTLDRTLIVALGSRLCQLRADAHNS